MKSSAEIAEKIFEWCFDDEYSGYTEDMLKEKITEAIDAYAKEAVEEYKRPCEKNELHQACQCLDEYISKIRREAFEEAAKIVEGILKGPGAIPIEWEDCCECIKKKIRAMEPEHE